MPMVRQCIHGADEPEPHDVPRPPARDPATEARPLLLQVLDELCARGLLRLDRRAGDDR
ncbi:hypothetical protein ABZ883_40740 [Streptomyces sp. NPDC046977]|uniref:hypothetical protein n=1 Tax=Streptomyces sp. NPDC046977 TaxID=3154703 RepID=UPI0033E2BDD4